MRENIERGVSVPIPGTPVNVDVDPVAWVNGILDYYKSIKINQGIQATERARIREYARICISAIEADTKKFEIALNQVGTERIKMVNSICDLLTSDVLDDNSVKVCELVLNYLNQNNPLSAVASSNHRLHT